MKSQILTITTLLAMIQWSACGGSRSRKAIEKSPSSDTGVSADAEPNSGELSQGNPDGFQQEYPQQGYPQQGQPPAGQGNGTLGTLGQHYQYQKMSEEIKNKNSFGGALMSSLPGLLGSFGGGGAGLGSLMGMFTGGGGQQQGGQAMGGQTPGLPQGGSPYPNALPQGMGAMNPQAGGMPSTASAQMPTPDNSQMKLLDRNLPQGLGALAGQTQ